MKDIIPAKKQSPILGLAGMGGGVGSNLGGSLPKKNYIDDVFNIKTYRGNATERSITTGLDIADEGGLIWFKNREMSNQSHRLVDTTALPDSSSPWYSYILQTNSTAARGATGSGFKSFNSDGFTIQTDNSINGNNNKQVAWSFRKSPGFFDMVTWTGTGSGRSISHNLGSVPGMILVKKTNGSSNWIVYHRNTSSNVDNVLFLNSTDSVNTDSPSYWNNGGAQPTSTTFNVGWGDATNASGGEYIAYLFAGGASSAATARSVDFDGSGDQLNFLTSNIAVGTGNFTCEFWVNLNGATTGNDALLDTRSSNSSDGFQLYLDSNRTLLGYVTGDMFGSSTYTIPIGQWTHIAVVRAASTATKLYVNGTQVGTTYTGTQDFSNSDVHIAADSAYSTETNCKISNFRLTKGQALYTSSFRLPTEPLTTTSQGATSSNVKILACNNSSVSGGTVVSTVQVYGNPTASTDSPFDDPEGFQFGEGGDQPTVKCGYYMGNGSSTGPVIYLGWEPQWVMVRRVDANADWLLWDTMRGIVTGGTTSDPMLYPNEESAESTTIYRMDLTSRGFKITSSNGAINQNGGKYIYMAIRRPDSLVAKPAESGTEVFDIDNDTNVNPDFLSNFPVDFAFIKTANGTSNWWQSARLMQGNRMFINTDAAESQGQGWCNFDWGDPDGWSTGNFSANEYSWMFKRHAGFDVVAYTGNGLTQGQYLPHNLNAVPEMIWCKSRTQNSSYWGVYHFGLNGGTSPHSWRVNLHNSNPQTGTSFWNHTAPTSEWFSVGNNGWVNGSGDLYIAMLFTSVTGISKCGYYTGNGSATERTITTGFQPRFLILKNINGYNNWFVLDTSRGWANGADYTLSFNNDAAQYSGENVGQPTSTGFTITNALANFNENGSTYIYYAHA